jgi:hypothetical protein
MQVVARVVSLEPVIASQYGGSNATHVPSYRYMFVDRFSQKAQASPPGKVSARKRPIMLTFEIRKGM